MSGSASDVVISCLVLDLEDDLSKLYEFTIRDTPERDFENDNPPSSPINSNSRFGISLFHNATDPSAGGSNDPAIAIFDNAVVNEYVSIGIESAVLLTYRDPGSPYVVEGATSVDGPWEVVE